MYKIISDSACDLPQAYVNEHDITIVPLSVSFDGETYYRDGVSIRHFPDGLPDNRYDGSLHSKPGCFWRN